MPSGWLQHWPRLVAGLVACSLCISGRDAWSTQQPDQAPRSAPQGNLDALASEYQQEARPLILQYCRRCHSTKRSEGDINLESLGTWTEVRKNLKTWQKVREMLDSGQMPPPEARQPTADQRTRLKAWTGAYLGAEASIRAGDPGPVVLRRLSNAEYTYTLRDLTNLAALEPAREFPVDGAAGEGFTNTGNALVMSPGLLRKYLDAAKEVSRHAVLLPDGFRFSPYTTRRDWTNAIVEEIRNFSRHFTDSSGGTRVNLQGIIGETNQGGRLPVEKYLSATLAERESLLGGRKNIETVAHERGMNSRYLEALWKNLTSKEPSLLLDRLRTRWHTAGPDDGAALAAFVAAWQKELWRFTTVGHIGKVGGPKSWQEPVNPLLAGQEVRYKLASTLPSKEITFSLVASNVGVGSEQPVVVWQQPRLVAPGRPDILLRDARAVCRDLDARRQQMLGDTARHLAAAGEAEAAQGKFDLVLLAQKHRVEVEGLRAWLDYLGIGTGGSAKIETYFTDKIMQASGYDFIKGWGTAETPLLVANSSGEHVRIPGNMWPHSVAVHPSPTLQAVVGWRSPLAAVMRIEGKVTHAHPECGNGVTWSLELRRGNIRRRLAAGTAQGGKPVTIGPIEEVALSPGDLVSLLIGPRDGNHACDLTALELKLTSRGDQGRTWDLARDVSGDVLAGNPHADRFGNAGVWHFYTEPDRQVTFEPVITPGSLLAKWRAARGAEEKETLAANLQEILTNPQPPAEEGPDALLYKQIRSLGGPLFRNLLQSSTAERSGAPIKNVTRSIARARATEWGLDPALFGKRPESGPVDSASIWSRAPSIITVRLPSEVAAGCELVTTGLIDGAISKEGAVQLRVLPDIPASDPGFHPGTPIVVNEGTSAHRRLESGFEEFRRLFPAALCYSRIVPVDEVITLTLFYREDDHLARLMLDERQRAGLDRLWDELHYVSQDALTLVDALAQLLEYASQDADPKVFAPLRKPIQEHADAFRQRLIDTQPRQLDALLEFADQAYRRPLGEGEKEALRRLYHKLRREGIAHEEAFRLTLARILVAPAFLYRVEQPGAGSEPSPVSDLELASRLSYFLWSTQPDAELRRLAAAGRLHNKEILTRQAQRMLHHQRVRHLATEFACQWLHIYDFDRLDEKSERNFPTFAGLRGAMYEESIQFFTDLFQRGGSVLDILDSDYTFLNEALAKHYGIPGITGPEWRRVEGVKQYSRGGILAQATTLAKQSGASRTSPILRGNWISEVLLGERLPRPPKDVPRLPEDESAASALTVRQLVEKHSSDPKCAVCHQRIDAFGFSLEGFDAIGRRRDKDLGDRQIDTRVKTMDGSQFADLDGLREYLATVRQQAFLRQFCRKLLGYALGRAVQLSDQPLLSEMERKLQANHYRFAVAVETIVASRQFREIRGQMAVAEN